MEFQVSPTERPPITDLGRTSSTPEKLGVDVMWVSEKVGGIVGVQRKAVPDLIASVRDGRLAREVGQMKVLRQAFLVVEGRAKFTADGEYIDRWTRFTRTEWRSVLRSVQLKGVVVEHTDSPSDTVDLCRSLATWIEKDHHTLDKLPSVRGVWGTRPTPRDLDLALAQVIPGVGPGLATKVVDHFGRLPLGWVCTRADLLGVPGVGPGRVEAMFSALPSCGHVPEPEPRTRKRKKEATP